MSDGEPACKSLYPLQDWLITFAVIFFAFFGFTLSLICIFAMPDKTVRPEIGAIFFIFSASVVVFFLFFRWRKQIATTKTVLSNDNSESHKIIIKESISDKILKWVVAIFLFSFVIDGLAVALICIYSLPDKTTQPIPGLLYFLSASIPLGSFVFVVWKNWTTN